MVDAEDRLLGIEVEQETVELYRCTQIFAERLLQHDHAAGSRSSAMEGNHRPWEDGRWERQVGRQRPATLDHGGHAAWIRHVCLMVARGGHYVALRCCRKVVGVPVELG